MLQNIKSFKREHIYLKINNLNILLHFLNFISNV